MATLEVLCGTAILLFAVYYYYTTKFDFWKKRGISGPKAIPFFGTIKDVMLGRTTYMKYHKEIYDTYKDAPLVGVFYGLVPVLLIKDPVLIKDILITDGAVFSQRGMCYSKKADPMTVNIIRLEHEVSRHIRTKTSPIFTSSKIKSMFPLLLQRSQIFKEWLDKLLSQDEEVNCSDIMRRLTADFSAICMFGYDIKAMENENNEIIRYATEWSKANWKNQLKEYLLTNAMQLYELIGYYLFDNANELEMFTRFVNDIAKYREKYGIVKHDIAHALMEIKQNPGKLADKIDVTDEFIIANNGMLFLVAFETSAITTSNVLYEMALNQSIQDRLREEIRNLHLKTNGKITFDDVNTTPYLDAVIKETLRKYPVNDSIGRISVSAYKFKGIQLSIPKGQFVIIPVRALHFDPEIYPEPEVFDPERFLNEAASSRQSMYYIPFGHGARNCIGERFGVLQSKMAIITILRNYTVDVCERTFIPYEHSAELFVQESKDIYLKMSKIN